MRSKGLKEKIGRVEEKNSDYNKERGVIKRPHRNRTIVAAFIPLVVLAIMIFFLSTPIFQSFINSGIPLPEVAIEKIEFREDPSQIIAFIRNVGPTEITIAQADVNDRIHAAAIEPSKTLSRLSDAKVKIPFFWNAAEPYEVGITTDDGTRFSKTVEAAALAPNPDSQQIIFFAVIGIYVGIIPVMIGLLWYPFIKSMSRNKYNFFLSLTAGLLVFLGIDALVESNEITDNVSSIFSGQMLIVIVTTISFIALLYASEKLTQRAIKKSLSSTEMTSPHSSYSDSTATSSTQTRSNVNQRQMQELVKPLAISLMIAIGIGLHNFGEGLAIGAAVLLGEIALSTFLIVGFTLHNTTEGLAIVAPLAKSRKLMLRRLVLMGVIAGAPTIAGAWIGGFLYSPIATIIFLSIGAGAIFQVVYSIGSWVLRPVDNTDNDKNKKIVAVNKFTIAGFAIGMVIMYVTGLLV
jgi:zinc transporter, ZIP family